MNAQNINKIIEETYAVVSEVEKTTGRKFTENEIKSAIRAGLEKMLANRLAK